MNLTSTAFILAGGRSTRMGADKAFLRFGQLTLVEHAIATAREACGTVALVGDKERLRPYGWVIEDEFPGQGPLAGIHAGLMSNSAKDLNLFLAVDTPAIPPAFLRHLVDTAARQHAHVTVPRVGDRIQPLCAVYRREFATVAEKALKAGRNKIDALFSLCPVHIIDEPEIKALGFAPNIFDNVNTPEDWQRIQQQFKATVE